MAGHRPQKIEAQHVVIGETIVDLDMANIITQLAHVIHIEHIDLVEVRLTLGDGRHIVQPPTAPIFVYRWDPNYMEAPPPPPPYRKTAWERLLNDENDS